MTVNDIFSIIIDWAEKNQFQLKLNKGSKQQEIDKLENTINLELPEDLIEYLSYANGEAFLSNGIIGNWNLLDIKTIISEYKTMKKMVEKSLFGDNLNKETPYIKGIWWNLKWIPIVGSGSGHFICIDMDPNINGKLGQIILFLHDDEKRYLIAHALKEWFNKIAADMKEGIYKTENDSINNEALMYSSIEGKNLYK